MIDLTPLEVRQKKGDFRTSFRGYDGELVDDFLDLVADRMEELVRKNMELSAAVKSLEDELEEYRTKERALSDALMSAQKLREDARSHADRESEILVREARLAAESARQEASASLAREEESLRQVRARRSQLVESFRRLLERELSELTVIEETLELERSPAPEPAAVAALPEPPEPSEPQEPQEPEPVEEDMRLDLGEVDRPDPRATGTVEETEEADEDELQEDWLQSLVEE